MNDIENVLLTVANGEVVKPLPLNVRNNMSREFNQEHLFSLFHDMIKTGTNGNINTVTHIRTIADIMERGA